MCTSRDSVFCARALLLHAVLREKYGRIGIQVTFQESSSEFVEKEEKNTNRNQQKTRVETRKPPTYFITTVLRYNHGPTISRGNLLTSRLDDHVSMPGVWHRVSYSTVRDILCCSVAMYSK